MSFFRKSILSLKTITIIFVSIFFASSSYLLSKNLSFHSLKISHYYLLAKFCVIFGIEDLDININGSFGAIFTRKASDVANNLYVIEIFNSALKTLWFSILTSLFWTMILLTILVLLLGIKIWWESDKKRLISLKRIKKIKIIQKWLPAHHQKPEKEQNITPVAKAENIDVKKKSPNKSKNYRLISDKNLPYPIIKKVVLIEAVISHVKLTH